MVNNCANPKCAKPLHYLREGRIFVFDAEIDSDKPIHRMEHFWLCGACSQTMRLEKTVQGVQVVMKSGLRMRYSMEEVGQLAS
jgi:hypothetical protein